jgi:hypothetical protein
MLAKKDVPVLPLVIDWCPERQASELLGERAFLLLRLDRCLDSGPDVGTGHARLDDSAQVGFPDGAGGRDKCTSS